MISSSGSRLVQNRYKHVFSWRTELSSYSFLSCWFLPTGNPSFCSDRPLHLFYCLCFISSLSLHRLFPLLRAMPQYTHTPPKIQTWGVTLLLSWDTQHRLHLCTLACIPCPSQSSCFMILKLSAYPARYLVGSSVRIGALSLYPQCIVWCEQTYSEFGMKACLWNMWSSAEVHPVSQQLCHCRSLSVQAKVLSPILSGKLSLSKPSVTCICFLVST